MTCVLKEVSTSMKVENVLNLAKRAEEQLSLAEILKKGEDACKDCNPLSPIVCVARCNIWKLKSELRKLYEKMKNPVFMINLLNTLKNKRRIQILKMISKRRFSISRLQQELKELGYYHSRKTIAEEYINALIEVGLADENQGQYHATTFGCRLNELLKDFNGLENILPPHSMCYEEVTLDMLLSEPKTFEDLKGVIPTKSVARVLSRLQKTGLIETAKEKDHVFYFRTKRDPENAKFSPTERRVYESIPVEGISGRKLAEIARISLRRTYKYLRKLKGKKMIFARKKRNSYNLTVKGAQVSIMLQGLRNLASETLEAAAQLVKEREPHELLMPDTSQARHRKKEKEVIPLTIIRPVKII